MSNVPFYDYHSLKALSLEDENILLLQIDTYIQEAIKIPVGTNLIKLERTYTAHADVLAATGTEKTPEGAIFTYDADTEELRLQCENQTHNGVFKALKVGHTKASKPSLWYLVQAFQHNANNTITLSLVELIPPTEAVAA